MVRVWVAGKTVLSHCYTRAISERFRDGLIIKRYVNPSIYFFTLSQSALDSKTPQDKHLFQYGSQEAGLVKYDKYTCKK